MDGPSEESHPRHIEATGDVETAVIASIQFPLPAMPEHSAVAAQRRAERGPDLLAMARHAGESAGGSMALPAIEPGEVDASAPIMPTGALSVFQHQGLEWREWNEAIKMLLIGRQQTSGPMAGSWDPDGRWAGVAGRVYQTAIATLTLEVYYRYLPLFVRQR